MILPILLALLLLLESYQSLRRATMRLLRYSNQEQKISAIGKFIAWNFLKTKDYTKRVKTGYYLTPEYHVQLSLQL